MEQSVTNKRISYEYDNGDTCWGGLACYGSGPLSDPDRAPGNTRVEKFLNGLTVHLQTGYTSSLLKRDGLEGAQAEQALEMLKQWFISGGPLEPDKPWWCYNEPPLPPHKMDSSGMIEKAWRALILADMHWYFHSTEYLYGYAFHHAEIVPGDSEYDDGTECYGFLRSEYEKSSYHPEKAQGNSCVEKFLNALRVHLDKGYTRSLLARDGLEGAQAEQALKMLQEWLLSGGPWEVTVPKSSYRLPANTHPNRVDPSGVLDKAWHALILSNTHWYIIATSYLYRGTFYHIEIIPSQAK